VSFGAEQILILRIPLKFCASAGDLLLRGGALIDTDCRPPVARVESANGAADGREETEARRESRVVVTDNANYAARLFSRRDFSSLTPVGMSERESNK
jgi:hypothetical protein